MPNLTRRSSSALSGPTLRRWSLAPLLLALLSSGAVAGEAGPAGTPTLEPHVFTARDGTEVQAERGRLVVPMKRGASGEAGERTVELAFVRFPSTAEKPGAPIVYLAGGPGGSGISAATGSRFGLFQALRAVADVIAFDQRGTGDSEPSLDCEARYALPLDQASSPEASGEILAGVAKTCAEEVAGRGIDLSAYNTLESAADLEALRKALGADRLTLWGISYGTHLALATLRAYPDSVERAILAGVEPLHHSWKLPSDQQKLLAEISRRAQGDPGVTEHLPDMLHSIERLVRRLESEPVTVTMTHPQSGQTFPVVLGAFDLQATLANMLRGPSAFATMPDLVARIENGDWLALGLAAAQGRFGELRGAMPLAMDCASGASRRWTERIAREAEESLLADAINFPFPQICTGVNVPDLGDSYRAPFRSDTPVLLISGTLDGRTPPSNAESIRPQLVSSVHLVLDGAGHSDPLFLSSPEILETMLAFLRGGALPDRTIEVPVPGFLTPRRVVDVPAETLQRYVGNYEIAEGEHRRAVLAGDVLYTIRGEGQPFPIRPMSETRFFYEGSATWLDFELDGDGHVAAMVVHHDGAEEGERAVKIE